MNKIRKLWSVTAVLLLIITLAGCGAKTGKPSSAGVTVTDGVGRQIEVSNKVDKIATNYGIATHFLFVLGVQDKLVGIDSPCKQNPPAFYLKLYPKFKSLPAVGSPREVNVEEVIKLAPDLVLVAGRNVKAVEQLSERGITVFGVVAETPEQLIATMENLGRALGKEERAKRFNEYYQNTLSMISKKTNGLPESSRPKVYLVGPSGALSTAAGDMYQNSLIEMAGGKNVAAGLRGGWANISPEQLIKWNPDVILVVRYGNTSPETILHDSRWQNIKAVQEGKVIWFPSLLDISWDYPSPQACLGLVWLAKTLHPELFQNLDPLTEANKFYKEFYGHTFTELGGSL